MVRVHELRVPLGRYLLWLRLRDSQLALPVTNEPRQFGVGKLRMPCNVTDQSHERRRGVAEHRTRHRHVVESRVDREIATHAGDGIGERGGRSRGRPLLHHVGHEL